jgi:hypothetical protein
MYDDVGGDLPGESFPDLAVVLGDRVEEQLLYERIPTRREKISVISKM